MHRRTHPLTLLYGLDRCTELTAVLCFYYQTFPLKLGGALRPDEKSHVSAAFDKHSAKLSPERAGAQYQVPHPLPPISLVRASEHAAPLLG